ncbi:hypothetical protein COW36_03280 [bacterium (Candidatus Blackallbacteria) CG17_big_fil_post_rev_8_21_14_2_50_48_46]|uniref:protein O-GlcNAc transferase n=1 Tax=bacterium (Candidatus Blackallbacteria) CG17_big_fil_post_rev_8_21_14_2_50_48_46 TaxID=2014261 RepID=A0A2M7G9L8_9BACT|nr:MAG: hypothetical protein COW64_05520 [bacterium (Candidatus Blackallbacteria) CG18_big_fil_WC_8_21_14_2_50_49_26]PIW18813.1 MAG: hypothetical protein COW36_03280 [bacterium (Candidatus Blackallbacteria) CG17_big_fil_post_rev_8_21_14_2_50_48_46]PIW49268.1 MAG: hypothetical protein COW20_06430 [bacterium (Candidatus Blackallbacteria) CG13_big_fil_rev_8_21_14_2_50_49_14]
MAANAQAHRILRQALKLQRRGEVARAQKLFRRVTRLNPRAYQAFFQLGLQAEKQENSDLAAKYYRQAMVSNRRYSPAYLKLGAYYEDHNDFYRSFMAYGEYLLRTPQPETGDAYLRFARMLSRMDQDELAISFYLKALEIEPTEPLTYFLLAESLQSKGDMDSALACFMALGKIHAPSLPLISFFMGYLLERNGEYESALRCYNEAMGATGGAVLWKLKRDLAYPYVMASRQQIEQFQVKIQQALTDFEQGLRKRTLKFHEKNHQYFSMIQSNIVHIAYHHYNPLPIRRQFAALLPVLLPETQLAPWEPRPHTRKWIHLGLICSSKSVNLAFAYAGALFNEMDPERYKITVFCNSPKVSQIFNPQNRYRFSHPNASYQVISKDFQEAARQIREEELDLLMFTEPNWDYFQYSLASLRLARAQATSWMNPGTSGLPEMDYFFSSELIERPDAEADYSETLVRFKTLPSHLPLYPFPEQSVSRADFGLAEVEHLYACPQNLLKFHPDFDPVVKEILLRDPKGHLVLVATSTQEHLCQLLLKRFQRTIPEVMERIWVLPEMPVEDYLGLLRVTDVVLDPLYYGGGTTTYQAMAYGIPIVTLPTERMVGRITAALYQKMQLMDTVAHDLEDYIQKAILYASQPELRKTIIEGTLARSILFEDREIVKEFSDFMEALVAGDVPPGISKPE